MGIASFLLTVILLVILASSHSGHMTTGMPAEGWHWMMRLDGGPHLTIYLPEQKTETDGKHYQENIHRNQNGFRLFSNPGEGHTIKTIFWVIHTPTPWMYPNKNLLWTTHRRAFTGNHFDQCRQIHNPKSKNTPNVQKQTRHSHDIIHIPALAALTKTDQDAWIQQDPY